MPELPEIETIKRGLAPLLEGAEIVTIELPFYKSFIVHGHEELTAGSRAGSTGPVPEKLTQIINDRLSGARIEQISRQGKVLVWQLSNGFALLFHLKMTGQLVLREPGGKRFSGGHPTASLERELPDNSTRLVFTFRSGQKLFYNDQRKFGWVKLLPVSALAAEPLLSRLGPDPTQAGFSANDLYTHLRRRRTSIKAAILDQSLVAGVGNIYADEALHLAQLHPATAANRLSRRQVEQLAAALKKVMRASLAVGGTSFTSYVNALGKKGDYLGRARVFGRSGQACPECGQAIVKIRVAQRGTHICPHCQRRQ